jgi:WD40 repeat protein
MLKQRYVILGQAGRGGFGAVYKATDTAFGNRIVAIKEMSQNNLDPRELMAATEAFRNEAMMLASLVHPNLPRIYEQFTDIGRSYLVMDFIEGETLEHFVGPQGQKCSVEHVLDIALQLCSVLEYLHTRQPPIIFRDLKPANVMLTASGHLYLIDFGIARHFKPGQTKDTAPLGSSGYAAPEQYGRAQTTARADIYGLGATLHRLLTGDDPADNPFHFTLLHLPQHPALKGLDTLIMSMVSVDVNRRPASIAQVRQELQRITAQYTMGQTNPLLRTIPHAYLPPLSQTINQPSSQVSNQSTMPPLPRKTRKVVPLPIPPQLNTLYTCYEHASRITSVAWSPNGKYIASASYDKTVQIWNADNGQHILTYKGHFARVNALAWSPDSTRIASASDDRSVQVWGALTGKLHFTHPGHNDHVYAVTWSPDGQYIASAGADKIVHICKISTQMLVYTYRDHTDKVLTVAWSPDGKRIASAGADKLVHIWSPYIEQTRPSRSLFGTLTSRLTASIRQRPMKGHTAQVHSVAWSPDGKYLASASGDRRVLVWDMLTQHIVFFQGTSSSGMKNAVAWSPRGKYLAIGSNDRVVDIWNTSTKSLTLTYHGHTNYVLTVAWSPDGTRLASAGVDRTLQVWQAV